ncbi:MAG: glycerol kinase [Hyphomicrobiales bacterium]|nr:glycerol kinase [Hyphomicrobiales bacterium]
MTGFVVAIDQGTTNTKALALDEEGRIAARHSVPTPIAYPRPGWVEQSGAEIWRATTNAVDGCLSALPDETAIAAVAVANQRESVLLWRRSTGEPIGPCVTWQCRRSSDRLDRIRTPEIEEAVVSQTGLGLDPLFPAAKIGWLLDAYPDARALAEKGDLCAGTVDSWLLFNLTGGRVHATDASNASRTQLFDIHEQQWSVELCELFGLPVSILPAVVDSDASFGATRAIGRLPPGVQVRAMMGDSHAALFGHGIRVPGAVKATYGTGSSLMTLTETPVRSRSGLSTTVAWRRSGKIAYALEGNVSVSAQAAAWMAQLMGLPDVAALTELAATAAGGDNVCFVPALAGLGAPYWKDRARAALTGMSLATSRSDVARATLEAIALQICDVFMAMERDLGKRLARLSVDGGATQNDHLMRLQADLLSRPVQRLKILELSAFGVGLLAGAASGVMDEPKIEADLDGARDHIDPHLEPAVRDAKIAVWNAAVNSVIKSALSRY